MPNCPPIADLRAWIREHSRNRDAGDVEAEDHEAALLKLPANPPLAARLEDDTAVLETGRGGLHKREEDPVKLFDACHFCRLLT